MQERQEPSLDEPKAAATAAAPAPAPVRRSRTRRLVRALMLAVALLLITLCVLLGAAWWWSGQSDSLGRTLARVASWMPADQKLEADGVEGSLRSGGRIAWLRWTSPALQVEIKGADIAWRLQPLLQRELRFGKIDMDEMRIRSTPQPKDDTPTEPMQSLELPMRLDVPVRIERLVWEGPPETVVTELHGHYRYTGSHHDLEVSSLRYAQGFYEAELKLQAAAPMALQAQLKGNVNAPLPQQPEQTLNILAQAKVDGTLSGEAARLEIQAKAQTPEITNEPASQALSADIQAVIRPWLAQPVEQAQADLRHVDLALFMPDGPHTDLNGQVQAGPEGSGWALKADVTNSLAGPWDRQALPLHSLQAQAQFDGSHVWELQQARLTVSPQAQGQMEAQGRFDTQTQSLEGQATLQQLNPAAVLSSLDAAPLNGQIQAHTDAQQQVQFALDIQSAAPRKAQQLHIGAARAEGTWASPVLQVRQLYLDALGAKVHTPSLQFDTSTQQLQTQMDITVPGTRLRANVDAAPDQGQGSVDVELASAEQFSRWLATLPLAQDPLGGATLQGQAQAQLQWRGGWAKLQQRLQNPAAPLQASGLQLNLRLQSPDLIYRTADGSSTRLQQLSLKAQGTPEQLQTELVTQAQMGTQRLALDTTFNAGLRLGKDAAPLDWQAQLRALEAGWNGQNQPDQLWRVRLNQAVTLQQRTTGNPTRTVRIQASAGALAITPPSQAGGESASVQWEPLQLRQAPNGSWLVQSKGRLQGVPLSWVDAFSPDPRQPLLASAGLGGDLVVQGHWDIDNTGRQLQADVVLERASGDIRLSVEDADAAPVTVVRSSGASQVNAQTQQVQSRATLTTRGMRARLENLRLQVSARGNALQAQLDMQSQRAGQLHADVRSQFRQNAQGFSWPTTAPISGRLTAAMPNIGIWALFAPPGWRVGGTLNADVAISGTRSAPQWDGQLSADQLSILSLLDGIDLKDGRLRARLQGTRLDITELFLRGGEGSNTRILGQSGNLTAAPKNGGTLTGTGYVLYDPQAPAGSSGVRMDIRAVAERLQVLVRADRQLSVSGNLQAGMNDGQVSLRGDLTIDRAAIILADSSAPTLDSDVYVTSAASRKEAEDKAAKEAAKAEAAGSVQAVKPPDIQVKLDLGRDFALQGYGITTRLEGQLNVANGPRITGEIHTVNGRYRAWGQSLDVEQGTIRFSGPYANPAIDIIAIRPNIEVKAGVKVTGTANSPRVALFSEPDMSDAEKLSWVVMGRSAAAGGAETALLQQAALALLSGGGGTGNFAGQLGLDEIGLKGPSEDGEEGAALTIGKRLSKDFYVAYEQSLSGAMGTLYIFYDLSRRLTLRGQTGEQTAVDLIYTRRKD